MKKFMSILLVAIICFSLSIPVFSDNVNTENEIGDLDTETVINDFYSAISETDFTDEMHHSVSDVGRVYTEDCFTELDIESIEDRTD